MVIFEAWTLWIGVVFSAFAPSLLGISKLKLHGNKLQYPTEKD